MTVDDFLNATSDFDSLNQKDQVKLICFFYLVESELDNFQVKHITKAFEDHGLGKPTGLSSRISELTKGRPPILIKTKQGYEFHRTAKKELESEFLKSTHTQETSITLRDLLNDLKGDEQKRFLEEAISCFEIKSYRASVIMTWLLTIDVIYEYILIPVNLVKFNQAIQSHGKYRRVIVTQKSDFSGIKESAFIEIFRVSRLIDNDARKILDQKLGIRNSSAHPNTIEILDYTAIEFIQSLVKNIIKTYQ